MFNSISKRSLLAFILAAITANVYATHSCPSCASSLSGTYAVLNANSSMLLNLNGGTSPTQTIIEFPLTQPIQNFPNQLWKYIRGPGNTATLRLGTQCAASPSTPAPAWNVVPTSGGYLIIDDATGLTLTVRLTLGCVPALLAVFLSVINPSALEQVWVFIDTSTVAGQMRSTPTRLNIESRPGKPNATTLAIRLSSQIFQRRDDRCRRAGGIGCLVVLVQCDGIRPIEVDLPSKIFLGHERRFELFVARPFCGIQTDYNNDGEGTTTERKLRVRSRLLIQPLASSLVRRYNTSSVRYVRISKTWLIQSLFLCGSGYSMVQHDPDEIHWDKAVKPLLVAESKLTRRDLPNSVGVGLLQSPERQSSNDSNRKLLRIYVDSVSGSLSVAA
ncbi:hypothetical protein BDP27DRAFT_1369517 [Rhodocollybia butyracea]|uniref:Uncharacterized protein n=1 Tax=Rhodocollybia butyracea TaxID=206335 RepID=A0A9P5U094_9AGAR|nr:hypothetical protein BDP27DRAFT_1369517 [Rhodocollybia butyracea]